MTGPLYVGFICARADGCGQAHILCIPRRSNGYRGGPSIMWTMDCPRATGDWQRRSARSRSVEVDPQTT
jgi:hypothetical protein